MGKFLHERIGMRWTCRSADALNTFSLKNQLQWTIFSKFDTKHFKVKVLQVCSIIEPDPLQWGDNGDAMER